MSYSGAEPGVRMSRQGRRAVVSLFILSLFLAAANLLFTSSLIHRETANRERADAARASVTQLCESGNEFRRQQVQLWEYLVSVSRPPPGQTAAERLQREKTTRLFLAHIHHVFAPRDCHKE